jgi:hypothetical protein
MMKVIMKWKESHYIFKKVSKHVLFTPREKFNMTFTSKEGFVWNSKSHNSCLLYYMFMYAFYLYIQFHPFLVAKFFYHIQAIDYRLIKDQWTICRDVYINIKIENVLSITPYPNSRKICHLHDST